MQIVHIDLTENGTKEFKDLDHKTVQLIVNQYASYMASMGELLEMCQKDNITEVPVAVLIGVLQTIMASNEAQAHIEKVTEAGLTRDMGLFHEVNGKENLPDNVVSFKDAKKTVH